jgi:hypothetical protein
VGGNAHQNGQVDHISRADETLDFAPANLRMLGIDEDEVETDSAENFHDGRRGDPAEGSDQRLGLVDSLTKGVLHMTLAWVLMN